VSLASDLAPVSTTLADQLRGQLVTDLLNRASFEVKDDALRIAVSVSGGDRRLSRFGSKRTRGRTKMNVGYDLDGATSTIKMRPAAMWALATGGARPHLIGAGRRTRSGKYTRGRRVSLLAFPAPAATPTRNRPSAVRPGPVAHPGMRGRRALATLYARVPAIVNEAFTAGMASYMKTGKVR